MLYNIKVNIDVSVIIKRAAVLAFFLASTPVFAITTWDLHDNFSVSQNPNGVWTYGWEATLNGSFTKYDTAINNNGAQSNNTQWIDFNHHSGDNTPTVWHNTFGVSMWNVPADSIALHPGWDGSFSVVRWTSPVTGSVSVSGAFGAGDGGRMSYYISNNGVTTSPLSWVSDPNTETFSFTASLVAGQNLDFIVGTDNGNYGGGNTPLSLTLTSAASGVPEASTWAMMLIGFVGLGFAGYRSSSRNRPATA